MTRENKGWTKVKEFIFGPESPEPVSVAPVSVPEVEKEPEKRKAFATEENDISESREALSVWQRKAAAALASYKPKSGRFRIRQLPAGEYVIERRFVISPPDPDNAFGLYGMMRWADEIEKASIKPIEYFETVKNGDSPRQSLVSSYSRYTSDRYETVGYNPMIFNVFADAEAYLKRMVDGEKDAVEYDFPPLKRRVKAKPKPKAKPPV